MNTDQCVLSTTFKCSGEKVRYMMLNDGCDTDSPGKAPNGSAVETGASLSSCKALAKALLPKHSALMIIYVETIRAVKIQRYTEK